MSLEKTVLILVVANTLSLAQPLRPLTDERAALSGQREAGTALASGVQAAFSLPRGNGLGYANGDLGFQINVPSGVSSLLVEIDTTTPDADVDLWVRYGQDVGVSSNGCGVLADYLSEGLSGKESVLITSRSSLPLRSGTYYIGFGVYSPVAVSGSITATLASPANPPTPVPAVYPWQSDWSSYGAAMATFLRTFQFGGTGSFLTSKFCGKEVIWTGTVGANPGPVAGEIRLDMPSVPLRLTNGATGALTTVYVVPKQNESASWEPQALPKGKQITFRARLGSSRGNQDFIFLTISGVVIAYVQVHDGQLTGLPPAIAPNGVVNSAGAQPGVVAGSWLTIRGERLAQTTRIWKEGDFLDRVLPLSLDEVSVKVNNRDARVYSISPTELKVLAPTDDASGTVAITVRTAAGIEVTTQSTVDLLSPAFFTNGKSVLALHSDGCWVGEGAQNANPSYPVSPGTRDSINCFRPAAPGDLIALIGTAFGPLGTNETGNPMAAPTDRDFADPFWPNATASALRSPSFPLLDPSAIQLRVGDQAIETVQAARTRPGIDTVWVKLPLGLKADSDTVTWHEIKGLMWGHDIPTVQLPLRVSAASQEPAQ